MNSDRMALTLHPLKCHPFAVFEDEQRHQTEANGFIPLDKNKSQSWLTDRRP